MLDYACRRAEAWQHLCGGGSRIGEIARQVGSISSLAFWIHHATSGGAICRSIYAATPLDDLADKLKLMPRSITIRLVAISSIVETNIVRFTHTTRFYCLSVIFSPARAKASFLKKSTMLPFVLSYSPERRRRVSKNKRKHVLRKSYIMQKRIK
jgi:hypothetical protein